MPNLEPEKLLALLKDPNVGSQEIADAAGVAREDAAKAARLATGIAKAKPEDIVALPASLAAAVLRAAHAAGRADVLAAAAAHPSKEIAKEAKRGLHLLRTRGVAVPEPPRAAPAPAPQQEVVHFPCYASAMDGRGERAVWVTRNLPGRGVEIAQAVTSDEKGLLELQVGLRGRKEYRQFAQDLLSRGGAMGVTEVDRELAKALVVIARRRNDASGQRVPNGADAWLSRLGPVQPLPDPAERFPRGGDDEERALLDRSAELHELPMLRGWLADEEELQKVALKLDEIAASPLYLDDAQRTEQMRHAVSAAIEGYLVAARRERLARRLFATADHLARLGDDAHARVAAAAARAVASGAEAAKVPFVRGLFEKAFPPPEASPAEPPPEQPAAPGSPLIVPGR